MLKRSRKRPDVGWRDNRSVEEAGQCARTGEKEGMVPANTNNRSQLDPPNYSQLDPRDREDAELKAKLDRA